MMPFFFAKLPRKGALRAVALVLAVGLVAPGCGHNSHERTLEDPTYYFDNAHPFQPNRIWRLKVRWEPYLLDGAKAMLVKQIQLIVHGDADRRRIESEISGRGGDERYLRWFEAEVFPLGNWDVRDDARISRLSDSLVISLRTRALKEIPRKESLKVAPVLFPDPILRAVTEGCHELNWEVIPKGDTVGFEVVLESRREQPRAEKWVPRNYDSRNLAWHQWSVGQQRSIAYRTLIQFRTNISRCPLPPLVHDQFKKILVAQPMGVDW